MPLFTGDHLTDKTSLAGSRRIGYLLLTLVFLVIADGLISQFLTRYGLGSEGNPFLQGLLGRGTFLLVKLAGALLAALVLWDMHKTRPRIALAATLSFVILYTGIVFWNLAVFFFVPR
ncbi:MAG: DUF5658 family protein [Dehalococcoidales bacterium]|nr:DUF5658 family protein [Dehalococcoidales bacterium]